MFVALPVNDMALPVQTVELLLADTAVGLAFTCTCTVAEPVSGHPVRVPVTVYVVVEFGLAVTVEPVVGLKPDAGAQV